MSQPTDLTLGDSWTADEQDTLNAQVNENTSAIVSDSKLVSIGDMGFGTALLQNAASTAGTGEMMFKVGAAATGVSASWEHWYTTSGVGVQCIDTDPAGPVTFSASLRVVSSTNPGTVVGTIYRLTFNGRITVTLDPGGSIAADVLGLSLAVGDVVAIRTYLSSGTAYAPRPVSGGIAPNWGGFTATSDLTAPGSAAVTNANGNYYGPSTLLGIAQGSGNAKSVLLLGDSIGWGYGDAGAAFTVPQLVPGGWAARALSGVAGLINAAIPGDAAKWFQTTQGSFRRYPSAQRANSAIIEYGFNDFGVASLALTATALEVILLNLAADVRRLGIRKVFVTTITPYTTSTDGWVTLANQAKKSSEPQRLAHNTWVRAGCPIDSTAFTPVAVGTAGALTAGQFGHPITGFFDNASVMESSFNSGLFPPASRITTGSITSGSATLTSSSANFNSAYQEVGGDVGTDIVLAGAGPSGANLIGAYIPYVTNATTVSISMVAGTTVTNAQLAIGVMTADGIHPSPRGHQLIASSIDTSVL